MERRTPTASVGAATRVRPGRSVRLVRVLLLAVVVLYAASTLWQTEPGYSPLLDGGLRLVGHVLAALLVLLRPLRHREHRILWAWVAAAIITRSTGVLSYAFLVRPLDPQPSPSIADVWWLLTYVALCGAVGSLAIERRRDTSLPLILDGLVAALAVAALAVTVLQPVIVDVTGAAATSLAAVVVNLTYIVFDAALLAVLVGILAAGQARRTPAVWLLAGGIALLSVVDVIYLEVTVSGGFGALSWLSPLSALSLSASALIALAAWATDRPVDPDLPPALPGLLAPVTGSLLCLGLLVVATTTPLPPVAVGIATAGVLAAITRTAVTFRLVRTVAEHRQAARTDDLTGIANRRGCTEVLHRALARRGPDRELAFLVLDLDGFRAINDTYGHHQGDQLLRAVAERLSAVVRTGDLVARLGGDEFAVVMEDADAADALEVADRLVASLRRPFPVAGQQLAIEASIGIATSPRDATDADELLRLADLAMHDAKSTGSAPRTYDVRRHVDADTRRRTVDELRTGLADGQIRVHYQPQVCLASGAVIGLEALVRWQHPREGLLPPAAFLPLVESNGLMRPLTIEVLEQAAAWTGRWRADGAGVATSVNLSVSTLLDAAFPRHLDAALSRAGLPASALTLELTEELFLIDPARAHRQITSLLERGSRLWVDDYGTGYASLGYLRDLEGLAGIKLDRSFVARIDVDRRARAIVASTITMAADLDLDVIAEGVETAAVRDILADLGCRTAQGYLFARPQPPDEVDLAPIAAGRALAP